MRASDGGINLVKACETWTTGKTSVDLNFPASYERRLTSMGVRQWEGKGKRERGGGKIVKGGA